MKKIYVTKAFLPPLAEYEEYLKQIWQSGQLTNQGPLLKEFEQKASSYLGVENFHFVGNGTLALQVALRACDITEGEIITTPFSYVATTSAILWEHCQPVFVDIESDNLCIDANKIEQAITKDTKAIIAVHVFGYPCDIEKIDAIAKQHNLKVIYDAAHSFGAKYKGRSLLGWGDISIGSFHATKPFHTIEGGCLTTQDADLSQKIELIKRFGHEGDEHFMLGINAKASEFNAAMGLCNLKYINDNIRRREEISSLYTKLLGDSIQRPSLTRQFEPNYAYYPVIFDDEAQLLKTTDNLNKNGIFPRRYFYPALNTLPYITSKQSCPVTEKIATTILCLPLYPELSEDDVNMICGVIKAANAV